MINAFINALQYFDEREVKGKKNNPFIQNCIAVCTDDESLQVDETAWCSAFVNFICKESCLEYTGSLSARSWLKMGESIDNPEVGDIVIMWRERKDSWKGHVGFFVKEDSTKVWILGGNQMNKVSIKYYPKTRILGYRRLYVTTNIKG